MMEENVETGEFQWVEEYVGVLVKLGQGSKMRKTMSSNVLNKVDFKTKSGSELLNSVLVSSVTNDEEIISAEKLPHLVTEIIGKESISSDDL